MDECQEGERKRTIDDVSKATTDDTKTGLGKCLGTKIQGKPVYRLNGIRHEGGANLTQALVTELGKIALWCEGKSSREETQGRKYRYKVQLRTNS